MSLRQARVELAICTNLTGVAFVFGVYVSGIMFIP
jgi:hypothetical protein